MVVEQALDEGEFAVSQVGLEAAEEGSVVGDLAAVDAA